MSVTLLVVLLVCAAVTLPWGLATGSVVPFGILSVVFMLAVAWAMVWATRHPEG